MNIDAYLDRIGASGLTEPTQENLKKIQFSHLLNVPFENLDIHLPERRPIVLEEDALFEKIVTRRRGGYCYELNGLLAAALSTLGYEVTLLSGRAKLSVGNFGPEFDHLALKVQLDEPWLVDVGFGDCFRYPLQISELGDQDDGESIYRIDPKEKDHCLVIRKDDARNWWEQYLFNPIPRKLSDFEEMNHYHQTSLGSHFTRGRVITIATEDGRTTLSGTRLNIRNKAGDQTTILSGKNELMETLSSKFGIDPEDVADLT